MANTIREDLRNVSVSTGLLFATMQFEIMGYERNPTKVEYLPKQQALEMRDLIIGLMECKREGIDLDTVDSQFIKKRTKKIGELDKNLVSSAI